jgi:uncharacterized protein (TIGR00645 family)
MDRIKNFNLKKFAEQIIFVYSGKILASFYLIILFGLIVYAFFNIEEFLFYVIKAPTLNSKTAMLTFIELIDMSMVAGLGVMIAKGSYNSFVSKEHVHSGENIGSGLLKVKMKTSLITIVGVSLLQKVILIEANPNCIPWDELFKIGFVYSLFLGGALVLQGVDYFHLKSVALFEEVDPVNTHNKKLKDIEKDKK